MSYSFMIVIRGWVNVQENANSLEKAEIKQIIKKGATPIASFFMLSAFTSYILQNLCSKIKNKLSL